MEFLPWNSMKLGVRQFRWHEQFHGIPWNFKCDNFDSTSSSMEFHGTRSAPISLTRADLWNSMEFHGTWSAQISLTQEISWNSIEFPGNWRAPISLTREVPWNSMQLRVHQFHWHEQFHGIPWNLECANNADTSSSMEFHGIPWKWNLKCAYFPDTRSSMEFHGTWSAAISLTRAIPWNSMEFHGTWNAPISMTRAVPWNFMEFHGTRRAPISMTRAVLWNLLNIIPWVMQMGHVFGTTRCACHNIVTGKILIAKNSIILLVHFSTKCFSRLKHPCYLPQQARQFRCLYQLQYVLIVGCIAVNHNSMVPCEIIKIIYHILTMKFQANFVHNKVYNGGFRGDAPGASPL